MSEKEERLFGHEFPCTVNILGSTWRIVFRKYDDDPHFKDRCIDGYCSSPEKLICICEQATWPKQENESDQFLRNHSIHTLRHEIVHAFLDESGLRESTFTCGGSWALNEEMVDWFAIQGPKIYSAWESVKCQKDITT